LAVNNHWRKIVRQLRAHHPPQEVAKGIELCNTPRTIGRAPKTTTPASAVESPSDAACAAVLIIELYQTARHRGRRYLRSLRPSSEVRKPHSSERPRPGSNCVCSMLTASRASGSSPSAYKIVGATCDVATGVLIVRAAKRGFETISATFVSPKLKPPCSAFFFADPV